MGSLKQQQIGEHGDEEAKFSRLAQMKGWSCSRCDKLIQKFEYSVYKESGRCSGCQHHWEKMMSE
jgi:hypothetical protein